MSQITRLIGGAGTGKTTAILTAMNAARKELGLSPTEIGFATFTRSGRHVMARRAAEAWGVDESLLTRHGHFRTTHSTALRQIGISRDQLLTDDRASVNWVSERLGTTLAVEVDDEETEAPQPLGRESQTAAVAIHLWHLSRNRLMPYSLVLHEALAQGENVPDFETARAIVEKYESAKRADDRLDYADLLGRFVGVSFHVDGPLFVEPQGDVPEEVRAIYLDEAQDASALVDAACRRLAHGPNVDRVVIVGDNFQSIFGFGGGDAKHFMEWKATQSVMPQSYRCPSPIMAFGEECLRQMHSGYWDRGILPASHGGSIEQAGSAEDAIATFVNPEKSTLIVARCGFSLPRYEKVLDQRGIPYSRLDQPDADARRGCHALWRLQNGQPVGNEDFAAAIKMLPATILQRNTKAEWDRGEKYARYDRLRLEDVEQIGGTPETVSVVREGRWPESLMRPYRRLAERWVDSAKEWGPDLATEPRVHLSTIHAAKGAEADTVVVSSESSRRIVTNSRQFEAIHDEECRVAYVAATRARERLVIVEDAGPYRIAMPPAF
jgi:DNA helicase-2/ATP-dependent DNA helicase PcrA